MPISYSLQAKSTLISILLGVLLGCYTSPAQNIPLGAWRTHAAYLPARIIVESPTQIFCATENGLFAVDKNDNTIQTITKTDGLSENSITAMAYHAPTQTLIIGYENANIDLVSEKKITNIAIVKNANISGSKAINHIFIAQNTAYLSTNFGMIVIDLVRKRLVDTYQNLGDNGTPLPIYASLISRDSMLIATERGIRIAAFNSNANLKDFNKWRLASGSNASLPVYHLALLQNQIYANQANTQLLKYAHQNTWQAVSIGANPFIRNLRSTNSTILIATQNQIIVLNPNDQFNVLTNPLLVAPQDIVAEANNQQATFWIADGQNGMIRRETNNTYTQFVPNSVARSSVARLLAQGQNIIATSGGIGNAGQRLQNNAGFYQFDNFEWTNFNAFDTRNAITIPAVRDCFSIAYNPNNKHYYIGTQGDGLLVYKPDKTFALFNNNNSPLRPNALNEVCISGLAYENGVGLWVANNGTLAGQPSLHLLRNDNTWVSFNFVSNAERSPTDIVVANNGFKWMPLQPSTGGGILVFDQRTNRSRVLNTNFGQGSLPSNTINCLVQDQDGQMWVGTDRGIAVFFNPNRAFDNIDAGLPIFEARPLLRAEFITCIAIDGGNRKWIGTTNGLWLFNPDGSQLVFTFREDNSPLPSKHILSLAINQQTGEVFIATTKGIVSFRSTATQGTETNQNVKVFPNPVLPNFTGLVGIEGLAQNAQVKITDLAGRLVYQTQAQGGMATWNVQDYDGRRAKAGVYLIFSSKDDGAEGLVSKIAIVE